VSIFLKETSTRHSLLTKQKIAGDKPRLKSTGNKLTSWMNTKDDPITIEADAPAPRILQEEDNEEHLIELASIPPPVTGNKRKTPDPEEDDALFVSSSDEETFATQRAAPRKRRRVDDAQATDDEGPEAGGDDDKKKLTLNTSYDGFSIYGRILCLIVTRKGQKKDSGAKGSVADTPALGGSQMMEQWVSTQAAQENALLEDDEG
jgi:hypothetical protein